MNVNKDKPRNNGRDGLRARVRRTLGFALGVAVLALIDLLFYVFPRLFGRGRRPNGM